MPHFITTHSINNPNYIKMQQNKNQQLDAKFRKFIKVLIMCFGVKVILADGGYKGELVDNIKKKFGYIIQVVISAYKKQGFRLIQKMDCRKNIFMDGLQ